MAVVAARPDPPTARPTGSERPLTGAARRLSIVERRTAPTRTAGEAFGWRAAKCAVRRSLAPAKDGSPFFAKGADTLEHVLSTRGIVLRPPKELELVLKVGCGITIEHPLGEGSRKRRIAGDALSKLAGEGLKLVVGHDPIGQTKLERLLGRDRLGERVKFERFGHANEQGLAHARALFHRGGEPRPDRAKRRRFSHDPQVAPQRLAQARAIGITVESANDNLVRTTVG